MIKSCDSGSMPFMGHSAKFLEGAKKYGQSNSDESTDFFEKNLVDSFVDKLEAGIDVPNYPQFRDMNQMFMSMMDGIEKIETAYLETKIVSLRPDNNKIAEAHYKNDKKHGAWFMWDSSGTMRYEMHYVKGKKDGKWYMWDEEGNLSMEKEF